MNNDLLEKREKQVRIAVGLAAIDGGKPSDFTKKLLIDYKRGDISSNELKDKVIKKYAKVLQ